MSEVLLKIENLNKSFGITHANVNINFELKAGEVRGLAGENGSVNPHFCPRSQVCTEVIPEKCTSVEKSILRKTR